MIYNFCRHQKMYLNLTLDTIYFQNYHGFTEAW
jgi:hypothetical protein